MKTLRESRTARYKEKRADDKDRKLMYDVLSLSKWDFLRVKRAEKEAEVAERIRNRNQMTKLCIHAFTNYFVREIYEKFRARVDEVNLAVRMAMASNLMKIRIGKKVKMYGNTMTERNRRKIRSALVLAN